MGVLHPQKFKYCLKVGPKIIVELQKLAQCVNVKQISFCVKKTNTDVKNSEKLIVATVYILDNWWANS